MLRRHQSSPYVREALDRIAVVREDFQELLWARYVQAETACNGRLLNRRGLAAGVDPVTLFSGPAARALAYASDELAEWFRENPRTTFREYERQRFDGEARVDSL
jgi:hypothetical protein